LVCDVDGQERSYGLKGADMKVELDEPVKGVPSDELLLGGSSWNADQKSLKYAWPDKNGKRARGGEIPLSALPQAVLFAARTGYLTRSETAALMKNLVDVLAKPA
jgi:hypothetical protein